MSFPTDVWKTLIETPAPTRARKERAATAIVDKKAAAVAMWEAIDKDDAESLAHALAAGASPTNRRAGRTALWEAVYRNQWKNAELLRQQGFDIHCITQSRQTLYGAIVERDAVEEAERLLAWGVDPTKSSASHFLTDESGHEGGPNLLLWWLEHGNMACIPPPNKSTGEHLKAWIFMGMRGSPQLRTHLNNAWNIDERNPQSLVRKLPQAANLLWDRLGHVDNIEMARNCLISGWGMPLLHHLGQTQTSFLWRLVFHKAWNLVDWIIQVPELRQQMIEYASIDPRTTWWTAATAGVPSIEKIAKLGHEFSQQDASGNTVAHEVMKSYKLSSAMVQWFLDNHPNLLRQVNHDGVAPLEGVRDAKMKAQAQAMLMQLTAPTQVAAPSAARRRL